MSTSCPPALSAQAANASVPRVPGPVHGHWHAMAARKGFLIRARVRDRFHLLLRCRACGGDFPAKLFVLMRALPQCPHCLTARRRALAEAAGVTYLGAAAGRPGYGLFRAPCGHILRRQFELIERAARGDTGLRCAICHRQREEAEARHQGWARLGPCPTGRPNYRLYRHICGHVQRIAQTNMLWGHCDCARCGQSWSAKPSFIYLFAVFLPATDAQEARRYLKLGYSAHPIKRHRHQLGLPQGAQVEVLRVVAMCSGHLACAEEKAAHARLRRAHPDAVVPMGEFADAINVTSEIYRPDLRAVIEAELDRVAQRMRNADSQPEARPVGTARQTAR